MHVRMLHQHTSHSFSPPTSYRIAVRYLNPTVVVLRLLWHHYACGSKLSTDHTVLGQSCICFSRPSVVKLFDGQYFSEEYLVIVLVYFYATYDHLQFVTMHDTHYYTLCESSMHILHFHVQECVGKEWEERPSL